MPALSSLPSELLVHIFWLLDYQDVLRMRQVDASCKEIIDSSSQLRLLVELGRDGRYPIYTSTLTSSTAKALQCHLRKRTRWNQFMLLKPRVIPPQDHEFYIYEFTGGILAHCIAGATEDSISFQPVADPDRDPERVFDLFKTSLEISKGHTVPLPFKCAEFSFDSTQDLLVLIEDRNPNFPVHIYSASTGGYHSQAARFTFDDFVDTTTTGIDVEILINQNAVVFAFRPIELHGDVCVTVLDWITGDVLFRQATEGASSATLLSPWCLMTIRCGHNAHTPSLDIYDLSKSLFVSRTVTKVPYLRLYLPGLSKHRVQPHTFADSYFIQSTHNSSHADSSTGMARSGDTDVVCIQIRMSREDPADHSSRLYLFVSKKRLLQLASDTSHHFRQEEDVKSSWQKRKALVQVIKRANPFRSSTSATSDASSTQAPTSPRSFSYSEWTESGRFTRWLDGSKLRWMTRCATLGSKFVCIGNPNDLGLDGNADICGTDRGFVCILEFNERLFWGEAKQHREGVVTMFEDADSLTNGLDADVRRGMAYKISWLRKPSALQWLDLLLDSDHILGRLTEGFEIYAI